MTATKAVIISAQRCGGLFLAGCLSNHPDIHCPREEPFRRESIWQERLRMRERHAALLDFVLSEPYYPVAMCRLTYDQAFHPDLQYYLQRNQVRIVHLLREIVPTVTSTLLAKMEMAGGVARHQFDDTFVDDEILDVTPAQVVKRIKHLQKQRALFEERFTGSERLTVHYEQMTQPGGSLLAPQEAERIWRFLGVRPGMVWTQHRKMHRRPISSYYRNWDEIAPAIEAALPGWEGVA